MEELWDFLLVAITTEVNLDPSQPDLISWIWTTDGSYATKSAYKAQFIRSFSRFTTAKIRKAYAEPKCTMFYWLVLHGKILTADRLAIRGWPHDPICQSISTPPRWLAIYARTALYFQGLEHCPWLVRRRLPSLPISRDACIRK
jgi:hypothetical protein